MRSKSFKLLMSSVLIAGQFFSTMPANADYKSFNFVEKQLAKANEYFDDVNEKIALSEKLAPPAVNILAQQWQKNWRAYDKKRASQGADVDLLNERLRKIRNNIGAFTIQLAFAKLHKSSAEEGLNALNYGDSIAPNDDEDYGKEVRRAKRKGFEYRLSNASENINRTQSALTTSHKGYGEVLSKIKNRVSRISVFHPDLVDVKQEQIKLEELLKTTAIGTTEFLLHGEDAIAREHINDITYNYLVELIENKPVQLEKFQVTYDTDDWYHVALTEGDTVPFAEGEISPELRLRAYEDLQKKLAEEIEQLNYEINDATQLVDKLGKSWRVQANIAFRNEEDIAQTEINLSWANLGVEMSFAAMTIVASGGLATASYAPNIVEAFGRKLAGKSIDTFGPYVSPIIKNSADALGTIAKGASKRAIDIASASLEATGDALQDTIVVEATKVAQRFYKNHFDDFAIGALNTIATLRLNVIPTKLEIENLGKKEYYLEKHIELSGAQGIIIGDVIESVATNAGFQDFNSIKSVGSAALQNNLSSLDDEVLTNAKGAGLAIASTFIKVINQKIVDTVTNEWEKAATVAGTKAGVYRNEYWKILNVRNAMQDELVAQESLKAAVIKLIADGPRSKNYETIADTTHPRDEFDKIGLHQVHLKFSRLLSQPPVLEAKNVIFEKARSLDAKSGLGSANWIVEINSETLPADTSKIEIEVKLSPNEPYKLFDTKPETPPQLVKISRDGWTGYETGVIKHTLRIGPKEEVVIGMHNLTYIGHWFSCDIPKLMKISSIRDRFNIGPELKYQDVDIGGFFKYLGNGRFLKPFAPNEVIQICVDNQDEPLRDKENRIIATSDTAQTLYSNGYYSVFGNVVEDDDLDLLLLPTLPGDISSELEDLTDLIPRYNSEGEMIGLDSKVVDRVAKFPEFEGTASEDESITSDRNNTNGNVTELGSNSGMPNLEKLDSILPDAFSGDEISDFTSNANRLDSPTLDLEGIIPNLPLGDNLADFQSNAPRIESPALDGASDGDDEFLSILTDEELMLPEFDDNQNLSLGIDNSNNQTLQAPLAVAPNNLNADQFKLGELEGTPMGELITKLGPDNPIVQRLLEDGVNEYDQEIAETILQTLRTQQ